MNEIEELKRKIELKEQEVLLFLEEKVKEWDELRKQLRELEK